MKRKMIVEIISALFILLFVYTATSKLYDQEQFKFSLGKSPLISNFKDVIAWALPSLEIVVAALLFFPKTRKIGLYSSFTLMVIFTGYIGYMIAFTPHLPCSCGGVIGKMTWKQHLFFNIFFTLLAAAGIWQSRFKGYRNNEMSSAQPVFT